MLGSTLVQMWQDKYSVYATDIRGCENNPAQNFLTFDLSAESYDDLFLWAKPDIVIHCAAITNVDYCEDHVDLAMEVNSESVNKLLQSGVRQIFISSDAVFPDGVRLSKETDKVSPENIYGISKAAGEKYILDAGEPNCVVRTTIVGKNINPIVHGFVEWIVHTVKRGEEITLFDDAFFTPITIWQLAEELEWIINNPIDGIIHIVGKEVMSKYHFGYSICAKLGLDVSLIKMDTIHKVDFKAKRSLDQTLDASYYETYSSRKLPTGRRTISQIVEFFRGGDDG